MATKISQQEAAQAFVQSQIDFATELIAAKYELLSDLQESRDMLNSAGLLAQASEEQRIWIQGGTVDGEYVPGHLPKRTRRTADELAADADDTDTEA